MIDAITPLFAALGGAFAWTLAEYILHRGFGHKKGKNPFTVEHLAHHADHSYFAPTWKKALITVAVVTVVAPFLLWGAGAVGLAGVLGFVAMYLMYELVHRRLHTHAPVTRYGRWARRHHLYHHFKRPHLNHGVTTPLWDWVFGTLEVPSSINVPKKHILPWMVEADGRLKECFRSEFVVTGPAS